MCTLIPEFLFTFSIIKSIISSSFFKFFLSFQRFSRSFTNSYSLSGFQGFKVSQSCGSARIGQSLGRILSGIQCLCLSRTKLLRCTLERKEAPSYLRSLEYACIFRRLVVGAFNLL
ncbi:Berberine bridge enzyme-like 25, partial [Frankliniella fusca]